MRTSEIMTREVVSVAPEYTLDETIRLFEACRFRHLPVLEKGCLVGMISDRDIALATGWILASYRHAKENSGPQTVGQIMRTDVITMAPDSTINAVAKLMLDKRINSVPLIEEDQLAGLVTTTDLLRACRHGKSGFDWKIREGARVEESMSTEVCTITPDQLMTEAIDLCQDESVRHLPVLDAGELVGIISDRDLRFGLGQEIVSDMVAQEEGRLEVPRTPLSALMTTTVVTINALESLEAAADSMLEHGFSALPVVQGGQLIGIITQTDVLRSCC